MSKNECWNRYIDRCREVTAARGEKQYRGVVSHPENDPVADALWREYLNAAYPEATA